MNLTERTHGGGTPRSQGYRMPAEWERQAALWLTWPHNEDRWYGRYADVVDFFARLVSLVSRYETVMVLVPPGGRRPVQERIQREQPILERIRVVEVATDDVWLRDSGPTFLQSTKTGGIGMVDWEYNSWGGKFPPWELDNAIPGALAERLGFPCWKSELVAEGGALEVNGMGKVMTTADVLLNPNRNPGWDRDRVERELCAYLGVSEVLWLPGSLVGDDTDGHIDNLARFCGPDTVLVAREENPDDPQYAPTQENWSYLESYRDQAGRPLHCIPLPMPEPVEDGGRRLPASYANFLILNAAVLVPVYGGPRDEEAIRLLGKAFPGRRIHGLDCGIPLLEGGAVHCLSQQQPAPVPHRSVPMVT